MAALVAGEGSLLLMSLPEGDSLDEYIFGGRVVAGCDRFPNGAFEFRRKFDGHGARLRPYRSVAARLCQQSGGGVSYR